MLRNVSNNLEVVEKSKDMLHSFNFPYQVGSHGDDPYSAEVKTLNVSLNDTIVLASDGLWDNLETDEIVDIVREELVDLSRAAEKVAARAQEVGMRSDAETPFAKKARKSGKKWRGGKLDDITVIVAKIRDNSKTSAEKTSEQPKGSHLWTWLLALLCAVAAFGLYLKSQVPANMTFRGWITRPLSRLVGNIAGIPIPYCMRNTCYAFFCKAYNVNTDEIKLPLHSFRCMKDFFARELKPNLRPISQPANNFILCSPADSTVLAFGEVVNNAISCVKGHTYPLGELIYGRECFQMGAAELFPSLGNSRSLYYAVLYLSPADFHRYCSPTAILLKSRCHVIGYLNPVKPEYLLKNKAGLKENERVSVRGQWEQGEITMTFVGALNIGSMEFYFDREIGTNSPRPWKSDCSLRKQYRNRLNTGEVAERLEKKWREVHEGGSERSEGVFVEKGEEMGKFNFGSTIVLIFSAPKGLKFAFAEREHVLVGQSIFPAP